MNARLAVERLDEYRQPSLAPVGRWTTATQNMVRRCGTRAARLFARAIAGVSILSGCNSASPATTCDRIVEFERQVFIAQCGFERSQACTEPLSAAQREQWRRIFSGLRQQSDGREGLELACTSAFADRLSKTITLTGFRSELADLTKVVNGHAQMIPTIVPAPAERWEHRTMPFDSIDISRADVRNVGPMIEAEGRLTIRLPVQRSNGYGWPSLALIKD